MTALTSIAVFVFVFLSIYSLIYVAKHSAPVERLKQRNKARRDFMWSLEKRYSDTPSHHLNSDK